MFSGSISVKPPSSLFAMPSVNLLNSVGVFTEVDLNVRCKSKQFSVNDNFGKNGSKKGVKFDGNFLVAVDGDIRDLLPLINFANDCHSFNVQLSLGDGSFEKGVFLEVVRPIKIGEELLLWFSDELLAILPMAFLVPANIQGQKKYVCNKCQLMFEYPNPLKLHLTIDCHRSTKYIWNKLKRNLTSEPANSPLNLTKNSTFEFDLTNPSHPLNHRRKSCEDNPGPCYDTNCSSQSPIRPLSEPARLYSSAFQPYHHQKIFKHQENLYNNNFRSQSLTHFPIEYVNYSSVPTISSMELTNHAAQMETLVSNLGKSKQGHLCIYCGKVYSRKYGLKIHIRTHTGFKPLKCKYCLRPFGDPSNLNKHVRLHAEGETPYKCDLCGKVLVRKRDLDRHLRSRHMIGVSEEQLVPTTELQETSI